MSQEKVELSTNQTLNEQAWVLAYNGLSEQVRAAVLSGCLSLMPETEQRHLTHAALIAAAALEEEAERFVFGELGLLSTDPYFQDSHGANARGMRAQALEVLLNPNGRELLEQL